MSCRGDPPANHVVITGPMRAGKTTLGRGLADHLGMQFRDNDAHLVDTTGRNGRQLAAEEGVTYLHSLERQFVLATLADPQPSVIAAAASIADDPALLATVVDSGCRLIILDAPVPRMTPVRATGHRRPMSMDEAKRLSRKRLRAAQRAGAVVVSVTPSFADTLAAVAIAAQRP